MTIHTSISLAQVDSLEAIFAKPHADAYSMRWVVPEWLRALRASVLFNLVNKPLGSVLNIDPT